MAIKKISANLLGGNAVLAANIAGGAISAADIADNSITAAKISASTSPTLGGLTVTGTATIDGGSSVNTVLTLDSSTANTYLKITDSNSTNGTFIGATTNDLNFYPNNVLSATFAAGGDISFYEDTGSTAKFFWDASAESLGIGVTSILSGYKLEVAGSIVIPSGNFLANRSAGGSNWGLIRGNDSGTTILGDSQSLQITTAGQVIISTDYNSPQLSAMCYGDWDDLPLQLRDTSLTNTAGYAVTGIGFGYSNETTAAIVVSDAGGSAAQHMSFITGTNASAVPRMTIMSNGGVEIGDGTNGGYLKVINSSAIVAYFDRRTDNGTISEYRFNDSTVVGRISTQGSDSIVLTGGTTGGAGILCHGTVGKILPARNGDSIDNVVDLGQDSRRFKDLYMTGNISIVGGSAGGTITVDPTAGDAELFLQGAAGAQTLRLDQNSIRTMTNSALSIFTNNLANRRLYFQTSTDNSPLNFIGIGTTSPTAALEINGSYNIHHTSDAIFRITKNNGNDWAMRLDHGADDYGFFAQGNGSYALAVYNQPNGVYRFRVDYGGTIYANNTTVQSISDERLKENITDANSQWNDIKNLRFVNYEWIDGKYGDGNYLGLIAQEVEEISPNLVEIDAQPKEDIDAGIEDPEYKTVKYSVVWMKSVKALQEAMERIEQLEAEIAILKGE